MFNNFIQPEMLYIEDRCKETIQNGDKEPNINKPNNDRHLLLSNNLNLVQQEEPSNTTTNSKYIIRRQSRKAPYEKYTKKVERNLQTCLDNIKKNKKRGFSGNNLI